MSWGCATCRGECCRRYLVHISGRDAVTIARRQALAFDAFIDLVSEEASSSLGFALDGSGDTYGLCLRRRADGACSFLVALSDGVERCGIYPDRPIACAIFPLGLVDGGVGIRGDVICEPSGQRVTNADLTAGGALLSRASFEWSVYAQVVAAWNVARGRVPGRLDENVYFEYVGSAYDAIDALLEAQQPETAGTAIDHGLEQALDLVLTPIAARFTGPAA
jgi:Fe-S-cluster containining protein